jgi:translation initiation factor 5A
MEKFDDENMIDYMQAFDLHVGDYIVVNKAYPCKIVERCTHKTGKHGGCKMSLVVIDIFTEKKYTPLHRSDEKVAVPIIKKMEYQLIDINDEKPSFLTLMSDKQEIREDIRLPDNELGNNIKTFFGKGNDVYITIQKAMNFEAVISYKINKQ